MKSEERLSSRQVRALYFQAHGWMRDLALELLGDPAQAEDVAEAVFAAVALLTQEELVSHGRLDEFLRGMVLTECLERVACRAA